MVKKKINTIILNNSANGSNRGKLLLPVANESLRDDDNIHFIGYLILYIIFIVFFIRHIGIIYMNELFIDFTINDNY